MKSYTDIEQSKKLEEILSWDSADMFLSMNGTLAICSPYLEEGLRPAVGDAVPCWSLAALRNILPVGIVINENAYLFESHNTFDNSWVYRYYNEDDTSYLYCKNTSEINACVEMIIKLHELKML